MPIFESKADQHEQDLLQFQLELRGYKVIQTPTLSCCDFVTLDKRGDVCLIEFKHRDYPFEKIDPLYIDVAKIDKLRQASELMAAKPILILLPKVMPYYWIAVDRPLPTKEGGFLRTKDGGERGETRDDVYQIDRNLFTVF